MIEGLLLVLDVFAMLVLIRWSIMEEKNNAPKALEKPFVDRR